MKPVLIKIWCLLDFDLINITMSTQFYVQILLNLQLEITEQLEQLGINYDDDFEVHLLIEDVNGLIWDENEFHHSTIIHEPAQGR